MSNKLKSFQWAYIGLYSACQSPIGNFLVKKGRFRRQKSFFG